MILCWPMLHSQNEHFFKLFTAAYPGIVSYMDKDLHYRFVSASYKEWFGHRPEDVIGRHVAEIIGEESFNNRKPFLQKALRGEKVIFPSTLRHKDLGVRNTEQIYHPDIDESGSVRGIFALAHDVTERILSEKKAEESQNLFRTYAESMPQMAFISNPVGEIIYYNRRWEEYTGLIQSEFENQKQSRIISPEDYPLMEKTWKRAIESGEKYEAEFRLRRADGEYRWHLARAVPLRSSDGDITKWMGTLTDIHEKKVAALNLEGELRTRDEFISIASHELKTPLTSLKLQAQLFLRSIKKGDPMATSTERLENMANQSNDLITRLSRLIDDMLDVSRIRTGRLFLEKEQQDLFEIARSVVERMAIQFQASDIDLPSIRGSEAVEGIWDRFRLEQVITNLLTNAIRYGKSKPIEIDIRKINDRAILKVKDQGYGISKQDQNRIFDRFERAINASEVSGMGLGLFITKEIIKAHQGEISVESEPGKGAVFIVDLPLKT